MTKPVLSSKVRDTDDRYPGPGGVNLRLTGKNSQHEPTYRDKSGFNERLGDCALIERLIATRDIGRNFLFEK
jgi:hypothetical protein